MLGFAMRALAALSAADLVPYRFFFLHAAISVSTDITEGEGFEPPVLTYAGFQNQCIRPLCHPSRWALSALLLSYTRISLVTGLEPAFL